MILDISRAAAIGLAISSALVALPASATYCSNGGKWPECKPPTTPTPPASTTISGSSTASSNSSANAAAGASASGAGYGYGGNASGGNSSATSGPSMASIGDVAASVSGVAGGSASGGSSSLSDSSRSNMYVFPAPVNLPPLPAYFCPKGDSLAWSIGWNFFSYSTSSTRTELECLERVLAVIKASSPPVAQELRIQALPGERLHPVCTVEKPKRKAAKPKKVCK